MLILIAGLVIFLGTHSVNLLAPAWREHMVTRLGLVSWKGLYALVSLAGFVLIVAAYVPRNHLGQWLGHPMLAGVKLWAFGHLLATGFVHDVVLFGAFLVWAILGFGILRRRDRHSGNSYPSGRLTFDALTAVLGVAAWAIFALRLHVWLIGVRPL